METKSVETKSVETKSVESTCWRCGAGYADVAPECTACAEEIERDCAVEVRNLTPHAVNLAGVTIPASGIVARAETRRTFERFVSIVDDGNVVQVPIYRTTFGAVTGIPAWEPGKILIVSAIVAQAVDRDDLLVVDDTIRDEQGRIVGARGLARVR